MWLNERWGSGAKPRARPDAIDFERVETPDARRAALGSKTRSGLQRPSKFRGLQTIGSR
jgi:hypothetical protein